MPITFACARGKSLRVAGEHASRRVKRPARNVVGTAPALEAVFEVMEPAPKPIAAPRPVAKPRADEVEESDGGTYGLSNPGRAGGNDVDDGPRDKPLPDFRLGSGPRDKKRRKNKSRDHATWVVKGAKGAKGARHLPWHSWRP
jgi:hypothetical protein